MGDIKIPTRQEKGNDGSPVTTTEWNEWQIDRYKQDTEYRKTLTRWVMWVSVGWLLFVSLILIFSAWFKHFTVSDAVLVVLLGTTTANVLGLALIVLKGMFRNSD